MARAWGPGSTVQLLWEWEPLLSTFSQELQGPNSLRLEEFRAEPGADSHFVEGTLGGAVAHLRLRIPVAGVGARRWVWFSLPEVLVCPVMGLASRRRRPVSPLPTPGCSRLSPLVLCPCPTPPPPWSPPLPPRSPWWPVTSPQRVQLAACLPGSPVLPTAPLPWPGPARRPSPGRPK